jgi:peptidoglycan LD-endopeptidase LytH
MFLAAAAGADGAPSHHRKTHHAHRAGRHQPARSARRFRRPEAPGPRALIHGVDGRVLVASADLIDQIARARPMGPPTPVGLRAGGQGIYGPPAPPCLAAGSEGCAGLSSPVATVHQDKDQTNGGDDEDAETGIPPDTLPRPGFAERVTQAAKAFRDLFRPKSAQSTVAPDDADLPALLSEDLVIPVEGVPADRLRDSFLERRGRRRKHLAIDIGAPRGTPVLATADGTIARLHRDRLGGIAIYMRDSSNKYLFYYAHLSRYARRLHVGQRVGKGEVIGYVGSTGHAHGPHLHFAITRLPGNENLRLGLAINPYLVFLIGSSVKP